MQNSEQGREPSPREPSSPGEPSSPREWILLGMLGLFALALRLFHLTHFELWVDEGATWYFARLVAAGKLSAQLVVEPTPPLYYGLVGLLMRLFGESDAVMRLPSAIFGAAAVPALYLLGRALWNRRAGWIAAALVTAHPLHLFYSREARVYPLLMLLAALLFWALWRALQAQEPAWRRWTLLAALLTMACYSHLFGLFLGATAGLLILVFARDNAARARGLGAAALAGLLFAPYLLWILPHLEESGAAWSVAALKEHYPEDWRFGRIVEMSLLGADYGPYLRQVAIPQTPPLLRAASLLAQLGLIAAAVLAALRASRRRALGFLLGAFLLPLFIPWLINHQRAFFHPGRHDFYALGPALVLLAVGLDALFAWSAGSFQRRALSALVVAVLLGAVLQRDLALHLLPATSTYRETGAWLARHAESEDRVIALGIRRLRAEHYARLAGSGVEFESFPRSTDFHPGWSDVYTLLEDEPALEREADERLAALARELGPDGTLFVLQRRYPRGDGGTSATWRVDRHLLASLPRAGWRPVTALDNGKLGVRAFQPPRRER